MRKSKLNTTLIPEAASALPHPVSAPAGQDPLIDAILASLDDSKAEEIVTINLHGRTSIADAMIIASGRSNTHVGAIADHVLRLCKEKGHGTPRVEGMPHNDWVLVDAGDVIVHIFRPDVRRFYNLEKMWGADRPEESRVG